MDIVIRNLNPAIVKEVDEKAKKEGISRQEYLKNKIEKLSILNGITDREQEYRFYLDKMQQMMDQATNMMGQTTAQLNRNTITLNSLMEDD